MPFLLNVEVVRCADIASHERTAPDPYCQVCLLDIAGREVKNEKKRTSKKVRTYSPVFNEVLTFGDSYDLSNPAAPPSLEIKVFSSALVGDVPLGRVEIPLDMVVSVGEPFEDTYPLEAFGKMKSVSGSVHVRFSFTGEKPERHTMVVQRIGGEQVVPHDQDSDPYWEQAPNELQVTVVQARGLQIMDKAMFGSGGSSDPLVIVKCNGQKHKTATKKKCLEPVWEESFTFRVTSPHESLEVIVEDEDVTMNDFMGKVNVPLLYLEDKHLEKRWHPLVNQEGSEDGVNRGEIMLQLKWTFNPDAVEEEKTGLAGFLSRKDDSSEAEDDDAIDPDEAPEKSAEEVEKEAEEKKKAEEALKKELGDIEIKSGDYQVQVHIIEARDLHPEDVTGLSDPVVFVECFGQKQCTSVKEQTLSCVWDEVLIFNLRNLDKEEVEEAVIKISVMDADTIGRNDLIGSYQFDVPYVYAQKDHEIYRKWLAVMDDENPEDQGVQGYLKCSVTVLGPGDKLKIHDEAEDLANEAKESEGMGMVMMPPAIKKKTAFLVTTIHRAEYLPQMDSSKLGSQGGIDAFVQLEYGGIKPLRTKVRTVKGDRAQLNPIFNDELWVPISLPTMSSKVKYSVWDYDRVGSNEIVATWYFNFQVLQSIGSRRLGPYWVNLYGAPTEGYGVNPLKKMKRVVPGIGDDFKEFYNRYPDAASTFKGRLLISQRLEDELPKGREEVVPFRRKVHRIKVHQEPPLVTYMLKAQVISGTELPQFLALGRSKLQVRVSIGSCELVTEKAENRNGVCDWYQTLESRGIRLPSNADQMPDVFITLVKGSDGAPVSFTRIPALQLLQENFEAPPTWVLLREDKAIDALSDGEFPGSLLIKLGLGTESRAAEVASSWEIPRNILQSRRPYQLRCFVYQARNLPATDSNGLSDPFLKINFMGKEMKTSIKRKTINPLWYETVCFDCELPAEAVMPQVNLQLWDYDQFDADDYVGCCFFNVKDAVIRQSADEPLPDPKWYPLMQEVPGDCEGEVLLQFELVPKSSPSQVVETNIDILPKTRTAYLEVIALGARDMKPYNFMPMQSPMLEFEIDTVKGKVTAATEPSKRPTPQNPNFLQRILVEVELPEKEVFAPPIKINAKDLRLGGYMKPVVGSGLIDLKDKIPWSSTYKPPQSDFVDTEEMMTHAGAVMVSSAGEGGEGGELETKNDEDAASVEMTSAVTLAAHKTGQVEAALRNLDRKRIESNTDPWISTMAPPDYTDVVKMSMNPEDTGAGLFGSITFLDKELRRAEKLREMKRRAKQRKFGLVGVDFRKKENDAANPIEQQQEDEEEDEPPRYLKGRKVLPSTLEEFLETTPFETYELIRGQKNGLLGSTVKVVGKFKGLIRILASPDEPPLFDLAQLLNPKGYRVRLYVLRALKLTAMDMGFGGRPGLSDPYLKAVLGKEKFDDRENHIDDVVDADLYKVIEFNTELPGAGLLDVAVYDYDDFGGDDLIGRTVIDLEDRWFDNRWQKLGMENRTESMDGYRWQTKPLEKRPLYNPSSMQPQGYLECWVDILNPAEANAFPPEDVSLPPRVPFEIRIVIWKTKDVVAMDSLENMNDLYVRVWPEDCQPQETDTHWRSKKGKGSFNWRMKFDVELGPSTKFMKFPYLHFQMWDRDLLKWNDCIADGVIDIGRFIRKAYKKNMVVRPFEQLRSAKDLDEEIEDIPELVIEEEEEEEEAATNPLLEAAGANKYEDVEKQKAARLGAENIARAQKGEEAMQPGEKKWYQFWKREEKAAAPPKEEVEENEWIEKLKEMSGLYNMDPPDSTWLHMTRMNFETGTMDPMGSLCFSLEIWPKEQANAMPVGSARNSPNHSPYLPPPTGRLKFSWNPFVMGAELCGPALCAKIFCCIFCLAFAAGMIFCQPFFNLIIFLFCRF